MLIKVPIVLCVVQSGMRMVERRLCRQIIVMVRFISCRSDQREGRQNKVKREKKTYKQKNKQFCKKVDLNRNLEAEHLPIAAEEGKVCPLCAP